MKSQFAPSKPYLNSLSDDLIVHSFLPLHNSALRVVSYAIHLLFNLFSFKLIDEFVSFLFNCWLATCLQCVFRGSFEYSTWVRNRPCVFWSHFKTTSEFEFKQMTPVKCLASSEKLRYNKNKFHRLKSKRNLTCLNWLKICSLVKK